MDSSGGGLAGGPRGDGQVLEGPFPEHVRDDSRGASLRTTEASPTSSYPRVGALAGDLLGLAAIALCIPFVIMAIGAPVALGIRLLLWITGLL